LAHQQRAAALHRKINRRERARLAARLDEGRAAAVNDVDRPPGYSAASADGGGGNGITSSGACGGGSACTGSGAGNCCWWDDGTGVDAGWIVGAFARSGCVV
jgi:hypothetical protein